MAQTNKKRTRVDSSNENSASESGDDRPENLENMNVGQLKEELRKAQLGKNNAEKKLRQAFGDITNSTTNGDHNASSRAKEKSRKKGPQKRRRVEREVSAHSSDEQGDASDDETEDEVADDRCEQEKTVASLGRHFVLLKGLWLNNDTLDASLDENYDVKKRFDGAQIQGQLRDVLDILPNRYKQKVLKEGWFQHAEIGWFEREEDGKAEYASLDVPILHKDGSAVYDIHTCFLGPTPMRLFVALIRGVSGASAMLKNDDSDTEITIPRTDNMEHIHQIDHTEPGAIAASSVLVCDLGKSTDTCLRAQGDTTNIDYEGLFDEYLDILTTGLRNKTPSILHVFEEWDRIVFPNARASHVDPEKQHRRRKSSGYQRAMEAMRAENHAQETEAPAVEQEEAGGGGDGDDECESG
ncbi:hypothetical protein C8R43DRAFT_1135059 [Mycena crocata]|nr:hypothetical protein C8R43DRAFT_1135059 [Mycena crocata]